MEIIKKLKCEYDLSGQVAEELLDQIEKALGLMKSAEATMKEDAERDRIDILTQQVYRIPYGFGISRLGELKEHPGVKLRRNASDEVRSCLRMLQLQPKKALEGKGKEAEIKPSPMARLKSMKGG